MKYPIIDSLAKAYFTNGWNGFSFNLLPNDKNLWGGYGVDDAGYAEYHRRFSPVYYNFPLIKSGRQYIVDSTLSANNTMNVGINLYKNGHRIFDSGWQVLPYIFTVPQIDYDMFCIPFRYSDDRIVDETIEEIGETVFMSFNEYPLHNDINYTFYSDDIRNHMKQALPKYFPHPVIDALKRAETGTQTEEDNKILKHYLTPLGIGGI